MPRKKEKIIEQVFKTDLINEDKPSPLLKGLALLKKVKFHSVVLCESKEKKRRGRRIVFLPRHMKFLLDSFDEELNEQRNAFAEDRNRFVKERRSFTEEHSRFVKESTLNNP